jgi:hypothetical protein
VVKVLLLAAMVCAIPLAAQNATRAPVLLELFTSEGCSSCPPADRLLESLDRQPVPNVDLIVLSEHVDYWNSLGWRDPFSSAFFSDRQKQYADRLAATVYTPQLVIDGLFYAVGSDQHEVMQAISKAAKNQKLPVSIKANASGVHVEVGPAKSDADLYLVIAADHAQTQVLKGENGGHTLTHVAVVKSMKKIGKTGSRDIPLAPQTGATRVIAFLQDPRTGRILGAAQTKAEGH